MKPPFFAAPPFFGQAYRVCRWSALWAYLCVVTMGVLQAKLGVYQKLQLAHTTIEVEVAETDVERNQGLKRRTTLEEGKGMLFIFDQPGYYSFWMSETSIPLDVAFFDDNFTLIEILRLYPHDLTPRVCKKPYKYALEAPQGWFKRKGVKLGSRFVLQK